MTALGAADRAHRGLAAFAVATEGVSVVCSLAVVAILHRRLGRDTPLHEGSLALVNPWDLLAVWAMLAAVAALVLWGVIGLRRPPVGHRMAGLGVAGALVAFVGVAWALSYYKSLGWPQAIGQRALG
jgi:hypothetical protein